MAFNLHVISSSGEMEVTGSIQKVLAIKTQGETGISSSLARVQFGNYSPDEVAGGGTSIIDATDTGINITHGTYLDGPITALKVKQGHFLIYVLKSAYDGEDLSPGW